MPAATLVLLAAAVGVAEAALLWAAGAGAAVSLGAAAAGAALWGLTAAAVARRQGTAPPGSSRTIRPAPPGSAGPPVTAAVRALQWVTRVHPHLRQGLTPQAAGPLARAVLQLTGAAAVAVTGRDRVLATAGRRDGPWRAGDPAADLVVQEAMSGRRGLAVGTGGASRGDGPRHGIVAVRLQARGETVGALAAAFPGPGRPHPAARRLLAAAGAAVGLLLEGATFEKLAAQGARYRLQALRAQINPHFLYNVLTAVIVRVRTDPEEARRLLIRLADFFRYMYTVQTDVQLVPFSAELAFVRTYLHLERARFGDRLHVVYDIDPQILSFPVPALTIQPLVENAVKHGIIPKLGPGTVVLRARTDLLAMRAYIEVRDNGVGAAPGTVRDALVGKSPAHGIGLANIRERLEYLYGPRASMVIDSRPGVGTRVRLSLPVLRHADASSPVDFHVR